VTNGLNEWPEGVKIWFTVSAGSNL
jgi:hypothetical protein